MIVVGGGAAGMMAAVFAARNGQNVQLLEKNEKLGKKLFITGKGRCNITNAADIEDLFTAVTSNPKFLYSGFYSFTNQQVIDFFEELGVKTKIERGERVFPVSDHSSDVIAAFSRELKLLGVSVSLHTEVRELLCEQDKVCGVLLTNGKKMKADAVIVATGGISYPSTGSTGDGYRFAKETGANIEDLRTWEGLFAMSEQYAEWTDNKTPKIPHDRKNFFVHDYHFNYFQVGVESLGENFFKGENLAFGPEFETAWEPYAKAALSGGVWLRSGYATEPLRTGDSIVSVASSASVLYYSDEVTYEDNTSEKIEIVAMPCPVFSTGEKMVMQRGAGICTVKSTPDKEKACITFLKWLTETRKNVEFVTSLGYMPVKQEAFDACLPEAIKELSDPMYVSLYQAFLDTQENYTFYTAPQLDSYLDLETRFEELVRKVLLVKRQQCINKPENIDKLVKETLADFKVAYTQ